MGQWKPIPEALCKELKEHIQDGVHKIICKYYENQEVKPPKIQAPYFEWSGMLKNLDIEKDIDKFKKSWKNVVYLFFAEELPDCCKTAEKAKNEFIKKNLEFKKNTGKDKNCMPDVIVGHFNKERGRYGYCLYVGSCRNNPQNRIRHHLGPLYNMSGLHLSEWWKEKTGEDRPIQVIVVEFGGNIEPEYLSLIEDALWEEYKPLFGKKGPR
jgi:hypothetical protein